MARLAGGKSVLAVTVISIFAYTHTLCSLSLSLSRSLLYVFARSMHIAHTANESTANKISAASNELVHAMKLFFPILPYLILFLFSVHFLRAKKSERKFVQPLVF